MINANWPKEQVETWLERSGRQMINISYDHNPPAVIPLRVDDRVVGTIAIFSTLSQKNKFDQVDFELFKLLGQHAAQALVAASLFAQAEQKLPGLEAFLDLSV